MIDLNEARLSTWRPSDPGPIEPSSLGLPIPGKSEAEASLYEFVKQAWHVIEPVTPFVPGWHVEAVSEHLQAVSEGQIQNLLIMVPPGSTKSITTAVMWPAWEWIKQPALRWLFASYAIALAERDREKCGLLVRSDWHQLRWGSRYKLTTEATTFLKNDKTGVQLPISVRSGTTGLKGDRLVIDDAHNVLEAESEVVRDATLRWHDQAWWNRVNDFTKSARVVIGQRTHEKDLLGHLETAGGYEILRLPEEFEIGTGLSRMWSLAHIQEPRTEDGQLLRPERFPQEKVEEAKKRLGPYAYAAQHRQKPIPREGALIKFEWFKRYVEASDAYKVAPRADVVRKELVWTYFIIDPAKSKKKKADFTSIGIYGVLPDWRIMILDMINERCGHEMIVPRLNEVCRLWNPLWVGIESDGFQVMVCDEARATQPNFRGMWEKKHPYIPTVHELYTECRGKIQRGVPMIVKFRAGEILLPTDGVMGYEYPWLGAVEEQLTTVTGFDDEHDDIWDNVAWAVLSLQQLGIGGFAGDPGEPFACGEKPQRYGWHDDGNGSAYGNGYGYGGPRRSFYAV
jgi:hypothetical protein